MSLVTSYMVNGNLAYYMQNEVDMNDKLERVSRTRIVFRAGKVLIFLMNIFTPLWSVGTRHHEWFTISAWGGAAGRSWEDHAGTPPAMLSPTYSS